MKVFFISSEITEQFGIMGSFAVVGNILLVTPAALLDSPEEINAALEHEVGHLIAHDSAYQFAYEELKEKHPVLYDYHHHLLEQRADIHSGIQSKKNIESLRATSGGKGYNAVLKAHKITPQIQKLAPHIIQNPEITKMLEPYLDPLVFETIKNVAMQEYKKRTISPQVLQKIIFLCDQSTYYDDLLDFHARNEPVKN